MEQARIFIAIALSFLVFLIWDFFFVDREAIQPPPPAEKVAEQTAQDEPFVPPAATAEPSAATEAVPALAAARTLTIDSPLYTMKISENGAAVKSLVLKNYREHVAAGSPLLEMISPDLAGGTLRMNLADRSIPGLGSAVFAADRNADTLTVQDGPQTLAFSWTSPAGVVVEKEFTFSPDSYVIGLTVGIKNGSSQTLKDNPVLSLFYPIPEDTARYGFEGPSALIDNSLEQIKIKDIEDKNVYSGRLSWVAVQSRYFMSSVIPDAPVDGSMRLSVDGNNMLENQYIQPVITVDPGTQQRFSYQVFFGPKSMKVLAGVGHDLKKAVNFGMFDFIAKPCVWLMNFIHDHMVPNYGVAIILLTILTKILLWPLGTKSYKSMAEMKKVQPLMAEIREKYKNDKRKMNEEIMNLYKIYKVNPMGGCLPMVVQIPVFFALYRMLYEAIELRHAPFFGWITDLSAPDRLFHFDFAIPFMQAPYGIPVLTIVMGATMFLQQKMQPPMGDPAQAKMMMFMPIVFTVIFINFSSGLVLYWLVNNILSIAQQYYVSQKNA